MSLIRCICPLCEGRVWSDVLEYLDAHDISEGHRLLVCNGDELDEWLPVGTVELPADVVWRDEPVELFTIGKVAGSRHRHPSNVTRWPT
jgi:hypothetical protein